MKVFRPLSNAAYPVVRSEHMSHRVLVPREEYLVDDTIAHMLDRLVAEGQCSGEFRDAADRPLDVGTKRLLILCPGGIGDLICMKACLQELHKWYPNLDEVGFVSSDADRQIFLDGAEYGFELSVIEYPVTLRQAGYYGAWLAFGSQQLESLRQDITVSFSAQLGMQPPESSAHVRPNVAVRNRLKAHLNPVDGRYKVGVQIQSASHYRSWHSGAAFVAMSGLAKGGCDCYILGSSKQRIIYRDEDGVEQPVWGDGIYDMSGVLTSSEEMIAFASLMDCIVAPDSGFLHIGGALRKPTFGLFGLSDGCSRTRYYPTLTVLQGEAECSPCWCISEIPTCGYPNCIAIMEIDPATVVDAVLDAMKEHSDA